MGVAASSPSKSSRIQLVASPEVDTNGKSCTPCPWHSPGNGKMCKACIVCPKSMTVRGKRGLVGAPGLGKEAMAVSCTE